MLKESGETIYLGYSKGDYDRSRPGRVVKDDPSRCECLSRTRGRQPDSCCCCMLERPAGPVLQSECLGCPARLSLMSGSIWACIGQRLGQPRMTRSDNSLHRLVLPGDQSGWLVCRS